MQQTRERRRRLLMTAGALSGGGGIITITSFTQSLGSELVINGAVPVAFSADNPTSWVTSGEAGTSAVHQVGTGEDHTGAGTGYINIYKSDANFPSINQVILTVGEIYEMSTLVDKFTSGQARMRDAGAKTQYIITTAGQKTSIGPVGSTSFEVANSSNPTDVTVGNISVKKVTPNALVTIRVSGTFIFNLTLPASPVAGQRVESRYRVSASTPKTDYWTLYLVRNDANTNWDVKLDSVVSGTATNRTSATSVGTTIDSLKVVVNGDLHDISTGVAGTYTARGSQVNNATMNTNTGAYTLYSTGATPVSATYL